MTEKKKLRVLFLDIDGVLNSTRTAVLHQGWPQDLTNKDQFDQVALGLMRRLCELAELSVVLSSSWRKSFKYHDVANALDLPIMGATDVNGPTRGHEIARWLQSHKQMVDLDGYGIVDDDDDMLEGQKSRFIHTDGNEGLSWRSYVELCNLFGVSPWGSVKGGPNREAISEAGWYAGLQL